MKWRPSNLLFESFFFGVAGVEWFLMDDSIWRLLTHLLHTCKQGNINSTDPAETDLPHSIVRTFASNTRSSRCHEFKKPIIKLIGDI